MLLSYLEIARIGVFDAIGSFGVGWFGEELDIGFVFVAVFEEIIGGVFGGGIIVKDELAQSDRCETSLIVFFERFLGVTRKIVRF